VIHGGAGTLPRARFDAKREAHYRAGLEKALRAGHSVLARGGASLDAVAAAVVALEDNPLFNAGRGAVLNQAGGHELDASIMDGATLKAGAVAASRHIRNPVLAARAVMEESPYVMLSGSGADAFARKHGLDIVGRDYFTTKARLSSLELARRKQRGRTAVELNAAEQHGTVGAVARDCTGNLAAATSTGGFTHKMVGRIGDTPIIGAGTYADNRTCAVSATGDGEFFIRAVVAHNVSARMRYRGDSLAVAARDALNEVAMLGGAGGLIAVDRRGHITLPFTTDGMYRGYVCGNDELVTAIFN
jgi:isoaspartyl peptidase/L-asparaginase-like protein (Ntn-hydrolase superfamily)